MDRVMLTIIKELDTLLNCQIKDMFKEIWIGVGIAMNLANLFAVKIVLLHSIVNVLDINLKNNVHVGNGNATFVK